VVWFGTKDGASRYDGENWRVFTTDDGLADNDINSITVSADGEVWFGTDCGVSRYDGTEWTTYTTDDGLVDNYVNSIAVGDDGVVWAGTWKGLSRYDPTANESTGVEKNDSLPSEITIHGNFPNPFNPETSIQFTLPCAEKVQLVIYNISGQKVRSLISDRMTAGIHSVRWDGRDETGQSVSSGIYLYRLRAGGIEETRSMTLMR